MLPGSTRKYLRGLAHSYRPSVQIGKEGLTAAVSEAIDVALKARELIKVQLFAERDERAEMTATIEAGLSCECVGSIGRMAVFYRQNDDPEDRVITLPE